MILFLATNSQQKQFITFSANFYFQYKTNFNDQNNILNLSFVKKNSFNYLTPFKLDPLTKPRMSLTYKNGLIFYTVNLVKRTEFDGNSSERTKPRSFNIHSI